jgi:hypothetical protein
MENGQNSDSFSPLKKSEGRGQSTNIFPVQERFYVNLGSEHLPFPGKFQADKAVYLIKSCLFWEKTSDVF